MVKLGEWFGCFEIYFRNEFIHDFGFYQFIYMNSYDNAWFVSCMKQEIQSTWTLVRPSIAAPQFNKSFNSAEREQIMLIPLLTILKLLLGHDTAHTNQNFLLFLFFFWEHTTGCKASNDKDSVPMSCSAFGCADGNSALALYGLLSSSTNVWLFCRDFACHHCF